MEPIINQNFTFQVHQEQVVVENQLFVFCQFRQNEFQSAIFKNCLFIDCDFSLSNFDQSVFDRCNFKSCDFVFAHLNEAVFLNCHAIQCNFDNILFQQSAFGFLSTLYCTFKACKLTQQCSLPPDSRELIAEIIRQSGASADVLGFAGFVLMHKEFCWETFVEIGQKFLKEESLQQIIQQLKKYPSFEHILGKFLTK